MPKMWDSGLVVTASQLKVLVAGQARALVPMKCAAVKYDEIPTPIIARSNEAITRHRAGSKLSWARRSEELPGAEARIAFDLLVAARPVCFVEARAGAVDGRTLIWMPQGPLLRRARPCSCRPRKVVAPSLSKLPL